MYARLEAYSFSFLMVDDLQNLGRGLLNYVYLSDRIW